MTTSNPLDRSTPASPAPGHRAGAGEAAARPGELADSPEGAPGTDAGELDLAALRPLDPTGLLEDVDRAVVWETAMRTRFRGLTGREGLLLHGPAGWGEVAPFWTYDAAASAPWLAAGLEAATRDDADLPALRDPVPVNVTVPEVDAERAREIVLASGATTAKVKIAGYRLGTDAAAGSGRGEEGAARARDLARLEAVRDALGPGGRVRVDVNGAWDLDTALALLPEVDRAAGGLEYAEQPVMDVEDLAALRRAVDVPLAADESIRLSHDPLAVRRLAAADVAVLKVAPLGGVRRALALAEALGLPAVVSSALDSSVGVGRGAQLAAALPVLDHACGLGTVALAVDDVRDEPALPVDGALAVGRWEPEPGALARVTAAPETAARWTERLSGMLAALAERRSRESTDPAAALAGVLL